MVYEGNEKYIFISYAHKDSQKVIPIVETLSENGFRVWYDSGIEAGTEWPEYIEDHLVSSEVVVVFMTPNTIDSRNCRNEINFALELKKEILVVYLEETELIKGMRLQLNSTQSLFRKNHSSTETFIEELLNARIIAECRNGNNTSQAPYQKPVRTSVSPTRISNVCSIGTNDENDLWPNGVYSQTINRDELSVIFFHIYLLKPLGYSGNVTTKKQIFNSENNLVFDDESEIPMQANYDRISTGWILKGSNGSFIPSGEYRFVCSVNNSPEFTYRFTITSNSDAGSSVSKNKSFFDKLKELFEG